MTAVLPETTPEGTAQVPGETYEQTLQRLSEASVDRHFDAFADIDWDHPDFRVDPHDTRWILPPEVDPLGAHPWYRSLPEDEQIAIGQWRQANIMKVAVQFENMLIRGIMRYVYTLPNGSPEFRYLTHEATEETHHTQMFQQGVNRIGVDVEGMPRWAHRLTWLIPVLAGKAPVTFFVAVLAGEEPIDHVQKRIMRSADQLPPVLARIIQIHVAEEARHISFAHLYVTRNAPHLSRRRKFWGSFFFPVFMRLMGDFVLKPSPAFQSRFGIPQEVMDEVYWESPASRAFLAEVYADVRMLAEQSGLMTPVSRWMWRRLLISGEPSRFRSEPPVSFVTETSTDRSAEQEAAQSSAQPSAR